MSKQGLKAILLEVVTAVSQRNGARNLIRFWAILGKSHQILQQVCPETTIKLPLGQKFHWKPNQKSKNLYNREVKHHVYGKRECVPRDHVSSFTCRLLFIISTHKLVVSRSFSFIRIVLSCFYLLISYFEKFSTWICRLPFAVHVMLKLSNS